MQHVLIVDDNEQNIYMMDTLLTASGFTAMIARNGAEALALAKESPPDLVIADILMPVMDGFELCRRLKADEALAKIPFMFYTATYTGPKDERLALEIGADRFVIKPQPPEVLLGLIRALLDQARSSENATADRLLEDEMEILRHYNEVLFNKLDKKVRQLESEIASRKKAQEALIKLNSELESRVEERTRLLKDALEKMTRQETLAAIGKLAGNISHELRNPLGIITNSAYFLNMKLCPAEDRIKKHLQMIQDQAVRATGIINDLLEFSRVKQGPLQPLNVHDLIQNALNLAKAPVNVAVSTKLEPDISKARLDEISITQAFVNIITNAYQAMNEVGQLEIETMTRDNNIIVHFKDTGVGIPREHLPKIFQPLFTTKKNGIGLGLSISKDFIERCCGTIEASSEPGKGSIFTVTFPVYNNDEKE